jgi:pSer/pThr/pTyr-binding forkhead associated (FHA) protein
MEPQVQNRFQTANDIITTLTKGYSVTFGKPHIIVKGVKHEISDELEIGRTHMHGPGCTSRGFYDQLDVCVDDSGQIVSKHHAKISVSSSGDCMIEDMDSMNCTAISHDGGGSFRVIPKHSRTALRDGDVIALGYNDARGPYITFTYRAT